MRRRLPAAHCHAHRVPPPAGRRRRHRRLQPAMRLSLGSWAGWKKLLIDQFMLISYAIAAIIALTWPAPGRAVNDVTISINGKAYQVFTVLCIMIGGWSCRMR